MFYVSDLEQVISLVHLHVFICKIKILVFKISNMFLVMISVLVQEECLNLGNVLDSKTGVSLAPGAEDGKYPNLRATHI